MLKKILWLVAASFLVITAVLVINFLQFTAPKYAPAFEQVSLSTDANELAHALTMETISHKAGMIDDSAFYDLQAFAERTFPMVDSILERTTINKHAQIYFWEGKSRHEKPVILTAHLDVVPVEFSTKDEWNAKPFGGKVKDGFIYGRGALDDKGSYIGILSAVEKLLASGFTPSRSIYLCFGHDEEVGGDLGAKAIVAHLQEKKVKAAFVLDEGGILSQGIVPGIDKPVALIGTSEKGYVSLDVEVKMEGGHSSMPASKTANSVLVEALHKLNTNPLPNRFSEPLEGFVQCVGPELPFTQKLAFSNRWLFEPLIFSIYNKTASGSALVRTTQTNTILRAGIKDNVIPSRALATVNYRLLPGDSPESILQRAKEIIDDTLVTVSIHDDFSVGASPVSDYKHPAFTYLQQTISTVFPNTVVSPYLVLGATDGRYYYPLSDQVYRFLPILMKPDDIPRLHGVNERISETDYTNLVKFYYILFSNLNELNSGT